MAEKQEKQSGAESPTTARELDFDDDPQESATFPPQDNPVASPPANTPKKKVSFQENEGDLAPPSKPPRPMSPAAQAEATLVEAFPDTDPKVVKAVLVASHYKVEPAFNALLGMSDPNYNAEDAPPPPQPPRPTAARTQLESDELYARQLAAHYQNAGREGYGSRSRGDPALPRRSGQGSLNPNELDEDRSFFDDDLPEIGESIKQGFMETRTKFNQWISDFKKNLDGDEDEVPPRQSGPSQRGFASPDGGYGRRSGEGRRSGDRERYDADPHVLGDDFSGLELKDNDPPPQPPRPGRTPANPDLFKPTPTAPQSGPVDEVDALYRNDGAPQASPLSGGKTKKWQPLTQVAPAPEQDEHDPFSLGDSDDEEARNKDLKTEDTERLKKAAAEATVTSPTKDEQPKPAERSGSMATRDKEAEELLKGEK